MSMLAYKQRYILTYPHAENISGSQAFSAIRSPRHKSSSSPVPSAAIQSRVASTLLKKIVNQK